jgi:hypothetical protein
MSTFVFTYRGPTGFTPSPERGQAWMAWFDGMADQLVDLGKPTVARSTLGNVSAADTDLAGYTVIQADDLEAATAIARGCPLLNDGGGVEIGELGAVPEHVSVRAQSAG